MSLGFDSIGSRSIASIPFVLKSDVAISTLYVASRSFTSKGTDTPKNTHFDGIMLIPPQIDRSLLAGPGLFLDGQAVRTIGEAVFENSDGQLDSIVDDFAVDGRRVLAKVGEITENEDGTHNDPAYADCELLFDGAGVSWSFSPDRVSLSFRGNESLLEVPILSERYAGTGGKEGDGSLTSPGDLEGTPKPLAFGSLENITPILVNESPTYLYQVSKRKIKDITAVYDRGVELTRRQNFPTYEALFGASTSQLSSYHLCKNEGMFKLTSPPVGQVTCDVEGDQSPTYFDDTGALIKHLAINLAGLEPNLVDHASFATYRELQSDEVGIYLTEEGITIADVIDDLARGASAFWGFNRSGRLMLSMIEDPTGKAGEIIDDTEIISLDRLPLPWGRPPFRISVGFRLNYTPLGEADLAAAATKRQFRLLQYRIADARDGSVRTAHPSAIDPDPVASFFTRRAAAEAEAVRLLNLYRPGVALYRVLVKGRGLNKEINDVVVLKYPRWSLNTGKPHRVVGIRQDNEANQTELICFG